MSDNLLELINKSLQYGNLFKTVIDGTEFIFRCLTRKEFSRIAELNILDFQKEELICKMCVISPENFDFSNMLSGVVTTLSTLIQKTSGFPRIPAGDLDKLPPNVKEEFDKDVKEIMGKLDVYREQMLSDADRRIEALIIAAFPGITLEYLDNLSFDAWLRYLAAAEFILTALHGIPPQVIQRVLNTNEPKKKSAVEMIKEMSTPTPILSGNIPDGADISSLPPELQKQAEIQRLIKMIYKNKKF